MPKKKPTHGGKRPGSGRKAPLGRKITWSVVTLPATKDRLRAAGIRAGQALDAIAAKLP